MQRMTRKALVAEIDARAASKDRLVVAIAGAPGSGKSTLAKDLVGLLSHPAEVLPMDGFHLDNEELAERGLIDRKGAPNTFDVTGFVALVARLRDKGRINYPTFDRDRDQTVPDGGRILASTRIVLVEGNYLLLNQQPWRDLWPHFDLTVRIDVSRAELEQRLMQRWRQHGLADDAARKRVLGNDLPNADQVLEHSRSAEFLVAG